MVGFCGANRDGEREREREREREEPLERSRNERKRKARKGGRERKSAVIAVYD